MWADGCCSDWIYPIGAVYISASATDPKTLFGGAWTRIKDRFLLAAGDTYAAGKTGGEASHTLTVDEIPDHTHSYQYTGQSTVIGTDTIRLYDRNGQPNQYTGQQSSNCGGKAHNNMAAVPDGLRLAEDILNKEGKIMASTYQTVRYGSTGSAVRQLQSALNQKGYQLTEDGIFGAKTRAAVRDYQKKNGCCSTGSRAARHGTI